IVDVLLAWVKAPVEFGGRTIERISGLPQGAVIAPLLANLYLDSFDEAIRARGYRMVRYADDFVILCRSAEDVAAARAAVTDELEKLRLELSGAKTASASFAAGFRFLGYLFCRSLVLDSPSARPRLTAPGGEIDWDELIEIRPSDATGWLRSMLDSAEAST